jgi:hypothetical protein
MKSVFDCVMMDYRFSCLYVIECCSPAVAQFSNNVSWIRIVTAWAGMPCSVKILVIFCMTSGFRSCGIGHVSIVMIGMLFFHLKKGHDFLSYLSLRAYAVLCTGLVAKYGITSEDVTNYMRMIQNDPSLVTEALTNVHLLASDMNGSQPLGLSTSNPLGCFIVAVFALLPLTVVLTLLLLPFFTLRVLTCMNFNDCANVLAQQIWDQMIQGLTQG